MNKWWGYVHINGTLQVKRYFDARDLTEAAESPFVSVVLRVVEAKDRDEATRLLEDQLA